PEWIETYRKMLEDAEQLEKTEVRKARGTRYEAEELARVRVLKAEANRLRGILRSALDEQTKGMREALGSLLTDEQWTKGGPLPENVSPGPLKWGLLGWADFLVP